MEAIFDDWTAWWSTVPPEFAFLLALPFVIAALGVFGEHIRTTRRRRRQEGQPRAHRPRPARLHS